MALNWHAIRDDRFVKIDHDHYTDMCVRVYYSLGGPNVWTGAHTPRGYWISVSPVKRGGGMIETCPMDGVKYLLKPVTRDTAKGEAYALTLAGNVENALIEKVCSNIGATVM